MLVHAENVAFALAFAQYEKEEEGWEEEEDWEEKEDWEEDWAMYKEEPEEDWAMYKEDLPEWY